LYDGHLSFALFTCRKILSLEAVGFKRKLGIGQKIIVGFYPTGNTTRLVLIALPADSRTGEQILWQDDIK